MTEPISIGAIAHFVIVNGPKLIPVLKLLIKEQSSIEAMVSNLDKKMDFMILRDLQSSFKIIDALGTISSEGMRERHLLEAESGLLKTIALDSTVPVASMPASHWVARCYFGLSCIAAMRKEEEDAGRHLLRAMLIDPRQVRKSLAKEFFTIHFEPFCQDIYENRAKQLALLPRFRQQKADIESKIFWANAKGGAWIAALGLAGFFGSKVDLVPAARAKQQLSKDLAPLMTELAAVPTEESIESEAHDSIDTRCREIANQFLNEEGKKIEVKV